MRRLLLSIAAIGLMAAFSAPLFAQSGDDDGGSGFPGSGGDDGGFPGQPGNPGQQGNPPTGGHQDNPPNPGGVGGYGSSGGYGGSGYGSTSTPPIPGTTQPGVPQQDPPPANGIPGIPVMPGGNTTGNPTAPANPNAPVVPQPVGPTNTPNNGTSVGTGSGHGSNGTANPNSQPTVPNQGPVSGNTNGILSSRAAGQKSAMDRPAFGVTVKMPTAGTTGNNGSNGNGTGVGTGDLPVGQTPPTQPCDEPPTFYGEPVQGKFCFILDASGSMAGARIASLRAEATNTISALGDTDEFDCMSYGTQFADSTMELWGGLLPATDSNKDAAVNFVNGPACNPGAGTPTHRALEKACSIYSELDKMFLLTDGAPNATGSASQILAHFPAWWGHYPQETVLVAICIGGVGEAVNFMRDLAAEDDSTGVFINRP